MSKYANNTSVSPERSQEEIKKTLRKYGADRFGVMEERKKAHVMFEYQKLLIQLTIELPDRSKFEKTESGKTRSESVIDAAHNQAIKQRWRALLLAIKAKLEAVECGISTIEQEFLAFVMMQNGKPLGDTLIPQIHKIAETGVMPKLLSYGGTE